MLNVKWGKQRYKCKGSDILSKMGGKKLNQNEIWENNNIRKMQLRI